MKTEPSRKVSQRIGVIAGATALCLVQVCSANTAAVAWGGSGGGGGGAGSGGRQQPPTDPDPCASLDIWLADAGNIRIDALPESYMFLAQAPCDAKKKKRVLKGRITDGPPVQQYPPPGQYPPPQYQPPQYQPPPPPPPPPPPEPYTGGVGGGGGGPPPPRPYTYSAWVKLNGQKVTLKTTVSSAQQGTFSYQGVPLTKFGTNTVIGYADVTITITGHTCQMQMTSPIAYSWTFTIPRGS